MKWKTLTGLFLLAITVTVISFSDTTTFADDTINQPPFTITIPKQLTIDADKCVEYQVFVHRNSTNAGTVTVIPDTEVVLSDSKWKADVTGQVTQDQTQFDFAADGADEQVTNGTVTANDLTAGSWTGTFNFEIDMQETKTGTDENQPLDSESIGDDVTLTSDNLEVYDISASSDVIIPEYVTDTGGIKHKVTSIDEYTFDGCSEVTSITIPKSVTSIGNCVASDCDNLVSIIVDSENSVYDSRNNSNAIIETKTNRLIQGCKTTVIPETVTTIGQYAFNYCNLLTTISIPDSVKSIEKMAFASCENLTSVILPDGVTNLDASAFEYCSSLTSICIPNSVTYLGGGLFYNCKSLTSVTLPENIESIPGGTFDGCQSLASITIPNSVTSIGSDSFYGCKQLISIDIPNSVTILGSYSIANCTGLTSISIPDDITSIGERAFGDCANLSSVTYKGNTYTTKTDIETALEESNVTLGSVIFDNTALSE